MIPCPLPKPHQSKLVALAANRKLPDVDKPRVEQALERYAKWIAFMDTIEAEGEDLLRALVKSLNEYKRFIEVNLIFDSPADFLYRQKGQHKVDNSVLEEFLPRLADTLLVPGLARLKSCNVGPQGAFAAFISQGVCIQHSPTEEYSLSRRIRIMLFQSVFTSELRLIRTLPKIH